MRQIRFTAKVRTVTELSALLARLKSAQRELILNAAKLAMMPSDGTLRKIADLENAIAAVEAVMHEEEQQQQRQAKAA
jgi:hypothetical protein